MSDADASAHADPQDARPGYLDTLEGLGSLLYSETTLSDQLEHVLALTAQAVASSAAASVTVMDQRGGYVTAAASDDAARTMDAVQYELREGPCIDSLTSGQEHLVTDVDAEERWPEFLGQVRDLGLSSLMSLPLQTRDRVVGALNIFGVSAGAFDGHDLELARRIALPAALTVANGAAHRHLERLTDELQIALDERTLVEQAKGVVVARQGCDPDRALQLLEQRARASDRRLIEVAGDVVQATIRTDRG
jgi:transcriptional regulator with GAF, ATPase, and Fis domain